MRIGMILDAPFPPDLRVEKEALTLVAAGHEVFLFCLTYDKATYEDHYKGITVVHHSATQLLYKLSALAYTVPFYQWGIKSKLTHFVATYRPDVLHIHDMVLAEAALSVAKKFSAPTVLDLHENRPEIMKEYLHLQKFPGKYLIDLDHWKRMQIKLASRADRLIVVTELAKQVLAKDTQRDLDDIIVVPNTPSLDFSKLPLDDEILSAMRGRFNLLYVGDTSERRGTADLLRAVKRLVHDIPTIHLWVVGKSSFDSQLRLLAQKLDIASHVSFEGWKPEKLFPSYITGSQICLSPLLRNLHHDTTFANKVFQYMSMGIPTIVSDCTAQADLVKSENAGLVFKAGDIEDLASNILQLYNDKSRAQILGENAKNAVIHRWNWEKTSVGLIEMYRTIAL